MNSEIHFNGSYISVFHDPRNLRIRIDEYNGDREVVHQAIIGQVTKWCEKLILKARVKDLPFFISKGFACKALVKGYFNGEDMYFLTRYFSRQRNVNTAWEVEEKILHDILKMPSSLVNQNNISIREATPADASALSDMYKKIFSVYPTPIEDPAYIAKSMEEGTRYLFIEQNGIPVSVASAEIDRKFMNAELTDCASLPEVAGKGFIKQLLTAHEQRLHVEGIHCLYTIARASIPAINSAFAQLGYTYGGRLIRNCAIGTGMENMNVWYKNG